MTDAQLAAVVERGRAEATIGALRVEGVYDDDRAVYECGADAVAIPVTRAPRATEVREVVVDDESTGPRTLTDVLGERGWTEAELAQAPASWAVVGSVVLVRVADCPRPEEIGEALLDVVGGADTVLAREGIDGEHREPSVRVLAGAGDTETVHREHGTEYALDLAQVMFSPGNKAERVRMGEVVGNEAVLDMFAGIGYFTLPMAREGARVTAIERNPASFQYLMENVLRNDVADTVETYRADCRDVIEGFQAEQREGGESESDELEPHGPDSDELQSDGPESDELQSDGPDSVEPPSDDSGFDETGSDEDPHFDRIVMGHYDAHEFLDAALLVLASGGTLHMHAATPDTLIPDRPTSRVEQAVSQANRTVESIDVRRIKTYSEGVYHVVADATID